MKTRQVLIAAAAACMVVLACTGAALASGERLTLRMPRTVKLGKPFKVTAQGFAHKEEVLALFLDPQRCAKTGKAEGAHRYSVELDYFVNGAFFKQHYGTSYKASANHLCGYLENLPPSLRTLMQKGRRFVTRR